MKKSFIIIALLAMVIGLKAQIGYQVSLLNTATGEPRANENVEVTIEITDSEGTSICKECYNKRFWRVVITNWQLNNIRKCRLEQITFLCISYS